MIHRIFGRLTRGTTAPALATLEALVAVKIVLALTVMFVISWLMRSQPVWRLPRPAGAPHKGGGRAGDSSPAEFSPPPGRDFI